KKTFVGCAMSMQVCIETPNAGDITINGVTCATLGYLKSGEQKTFEISDNAAKVFMIAGSVSKDYCNDFYQLPEGSEDITLTGKNKFNLANGNAFVFDNNDNPEALENRKKGKKKGRVILLVAILVGVVMGFLGAMLPYLLG
ncbi:MAG: hypothetical protein K2M64_02325, partial [Clostridia bacterium]|nr:hypothetical protein [Clostridia bacterium]